MKIEDKGTYRILTCDFGYLLRNKKSDTYSSKVYLGKNSSLDDFEEVVDETVDKKLRNKVFEIEAKEESLNKIGKIVANQITDDVVALEIQEFYDEWQEGITYEAGRYLQYQGVLYKVLTAHTSQIDWTPVTASSLFANVLTSLDGTPSEWVQPDSTNAYITGDKVIFEGVVYESLIDNNIWSPADYPAGWKVIEG